MKDHGFCNHCERSCLKPVKAESPYLAYRQGTKEPGDSLSFKIWDYDKAANNDLLAEGILDGSQFHKPGWATEQLEILSRCLHTHTHIYIYIHMCYVYYVNTRCRAVIRKSPSFINNHVATLFVSLRYIFAAGIFLLLFWNLQPLAGTCTAALPQVVLMASFICKPLRQSTHLS